MVILCSSKRCHGVPLGGIDTLLWASCQQLIVRSILHNGAIFDNDDSIRKPPCCPLVRRYDGCSARPTQCRNEICFLHLGHVDHDIVKQ